MRIGIFGAPPDTSNMGVSALFVSTINGLLSVFPEAEFVIFDNGLGRRERSLDLGDGRLVNYLCFGARVGRRIYRPESLYGMWLASCLGKIGAHLNEGVRLIDSCDAILDISGGDSFSDIYGRRRFDMICLPKTIALQRRVPLVLLPQTYGPYRDAAVRDLARQAVRGASMAWARDKQSFAILRNLLGEDFDAAIHRCGVDIAFALPAKPAEHLLPPLLKAWLGDRSSAVPLVGFNVSGLIYNNLERARSNYGFKLDYKELVTGFLRFLLASTQSRIVLVSHVMEASGHHESDYAASLDVAQQFASEFPGRIIVSPVDLDQSQVKWLISKTDWFCGTRMHATIAALSSGVPTATISYSDKAKGVFESCGMGAQVFDPREMRAKEIIDSLAASFAQRELLRNDLAKSIPVVRRQAMQQFEIIAGCIKQSVAA